MSEARLQAVIMAGGQGTRFWPLSREAFPKQFLKLLDRTMLQETAHRLRPLLRWRDIHVVCGPPYVELVRQQLPRLKESQIIVEPEARNTAPCIGLAALTLAKQDPEALMAVLPADHLIRKVEEFHQALKAGRQLAREGWLVTFGIRPHYPATGYGYLKRGEALGQVGGFAAFQVKRFVEKPNPATARKFVRQGDYFWNSGMFLWSCSRILEEFQRCLPRSYRWLIRLQEENLSWPERRRIFSHLEKTSIDYGVMEKARKVAALSCDLGWSDVGNWKALQEIWPRDQAGNAAQARYLNLQGRNCILRAEPGKLIALLDVEDLVVVDTADALLICSRERTESIRDIVAALRRKGWKEYL